MDKLLLDVQTIGSCNDLKINWTLNLELNIKCFKLLLDWHLGRTPEKNKSYVINYYDLKAL